MPKSSFPPTPRVAPLPGLDDFARLVAPAEPAEPRAPVERSDFELPPLAPRPAARAAEPPALPARLAVALRPCAAPPPRPPFAPGPFAAPPARLEPFALRPCVSVRRAVPERRFVPPPA